MIEWNKLQDNNVSSPGKTSFLRLIIVLSWSQPYEYDKKIQ